MVNNQVKNIFIYLKQMSGYFQDSSVLFLCSFHFCASIIKFRSLFSVFHHNVRSAIIAHNVTHLVTFLLTFLLIVIYSFV